MPDGDTTIELREYCDGDYDSLASMLRDTGQPRSDGDFVNSVFRAILEKRVNGLAATATLNGKPIAVAVAYAVAEGVCDVCMIETKGIEQDKKKFYEIASEWLDKLPFRRAQAHVTVDFPVGYRFMRNLGFHCDGVLENYAGPGIDSFLMSRSGKGHS